MRGTIEIKRNVAYTQAYGCWLCLHVGGTAVYIGKRNGFGARVELFTESHRLRVVAGF